MELQFGAKPGPYGEVWKARDPRLIRNVAIKTSRVGFSGRFQKEAQAVAALNHSGICTLFDVGPDYPVMEYIEGPTLAERIAQGPIPLAWTPNGRIPAIAQEYRGTLWKFQPHPEAK
jgi:serine/threonine protein kinase